MCFIKLKESSIDLFSSPALISYLFFYLLRRCSRLKLDIIDLRFCVWKVCLLLLFSREIEGEFGNHTGKKIHFCVQAILSE